MHDESISFTPCLLLLNLKFFPVWKLLFHYIKNIFENWQKWKFSIYLFVGLLYNNIYFYLFTIQ